jgi:hypothetical protein
MLTQLLPLMFPSVLRMMEEKKKHLAAAAATVAKRAICVRRRWWPSWGNSVVPSSEKRLPWRRRRMVGCRRMATCEP